MARFLALDWDQQQLTLVSATVKGGVVRVQKAVSFPETRCPNPAEAEALGKHLRERLAEAGIGAAPVLACIGRDRLILKDIRHPAVPLHEEPAVVRFQVVKELNDSPDEVVIDYAPTPGGGNGERRALALVIRRELLEAYQKMCKAAGLKLAVLTPRPFGAVACLNRIAGTTVRTPAPEPPDAAVAVVTVGTPWTEFSVIRGETLLFARSLTTGPQLANEIRRSVAVHGGQNPQQPVRTVYVAGTSEQANLRDQLHQLLGLPVYPFDPFDGADGPGVPADHRGDFAGAVGLLQAHGARKALPINFAKPKQPKPPRDPNRRRLVMVAALGAILLLAGLGYCVADVAARNNKLTKLMAQKADLELQLARYDDDGKRLKAMEDWNSGEINWLDEYYDLTDRFPDITKIHLTQLMAVPRTRSGKEKQTSKMTLKGVTTLDIRAVNELERKLAQDGQDGRYKVDPRQMAPNTGSDRIRFRQQFTIALEMEKVPPGKYRRLLPAAPEKSGNRQRPTILGGRRPTRGGGPDFSGFIGGDVP